MEADLASYRKAANHYSQKIRGMGSLLLSLTAVTIVNMFLAANHSGVNLIFGLIWPEVTIIAFVKYHSVILFITGLISVFALGCLGLASRTGDRWVFIVALAFLGLDLGLTFLDIGPMFIAALAHVYVIYRLFETLRFCKLRDQANSSANALVAALGV